MHQRTKKVPRRKRKPNDPCDICLLNPNLCLCNVLPKLQTQSHLTLVIHKNEVRRTSNTGQLAQQALCNSEKIIRGESHSPLNLKEHLKPDYTPLLLYPSKDAVEIESVLGTIYKPIQLIVPDGNWRQASKVHYRHKEISDIPRVFVSGKVNPKFRLRSEASELGMSTIQAIAYAFGAIEGAFVRDSLLNLYHTKAERILWARGSIKSSDCKTFSPPW